jgi:hypothetical protein
MYSKMLFAACALAFYSTAATAADPVTWAKFPKLSEDQVTVTRTRDAVDRSKIEVVLKLPANVTWEKAVRALDGSGNEMAVVKAKDGTKTASFIVDIDKLAKLELCKAKAFGVLTGMYEIRTDQLSGMGGYRVTFTWVKD